MLAAFERAIAARADVSLFVSEAEAALFRAAHRRCADIRALSERHRPRFLRSRRPTSRRSTDGARARADRFFTGQMDYAPNVDAVRWFAGEVLPLLPTARASPSSAASPPRRCGGSPGARTIVTGAVADMRSWLAAADVVVAPLRIARGIQNKVLEAMAMARPVVASPAAFEGIEAEPGRDLLVADGAEAQAEAIAGLLADPRPGRGDGPGRPRAGWSEAYRWEARLAPLGGDRRRRADGRAAA